MKHEPIQDAWEARNKLRAEGNKLIVEGDRPLYESVKLITEGNKLRAEGDKHLAKSDNLHAEGQGLRAGENRLYARGYGLIAKGYKLLAKGRNLLAKGDALRAKGYKLIAKGDALYRDAVCEKYGPDSSINRETGEIETIMERTHDDCKSSGTDCPANKANTCGGAGSRIFDPYDGIPCTCTAKCNDPCKGECGCTACRTAYQDFFEQ
jgi:hypothetical protein